MDNLYWFGAGGFAATLVLRQFAFTDPTPNAVVGGVVIACVIMAMVGILGSKVHKGS